MDRKSYIRETIRMKGEIIHHVSLNEYHLNYIIAKYINPNKLLFGLALMNKLNFATRISIFKEILNQKDVHYLTLYPSLLKRLNDLQEIRNIFAHSMSQIPHFESYESEMDFDFYLIKTDKFFAADFSKTKYNAIVHKKYLEQLKEILDALLKISNIEGDAGIAKEA